MARVSLMLWKADSGVCSKIGYLLHSPSPTGKEYLSALPRLEGGMMG